jgi:choline dehydrogenase-like flavoprotein
VLTDANTVEAGSTAVADVAVIGAGAAGITLARELDGLGLRVVVLESGGLDPDPATQALAEGEVVGEPLLHGWDEEDLVDTRLRYLGGTTNHWAGFCRPLEPVDFTPRPAVGQPGWPFGLDELVPWYERAVELCGLYVDRFDAAWWIADRGADAAILDGPTVATTMFQVNFPFSFGSQYRRDLEDSADITVYLWANAIDLPLTPGTDQIDRIEVATLDGNRFTVTADAYVLASGGIENARLLLASNRDRPAGLGNEHDLVGRYFTEHLQVMGGFAILERSADELTLYTGVEAPAPTTRDPDHMVSGRGILHLTSSAVEELELLGLETQLLITPLDTGGPSYAGGTGAVDVDRLATSVDGQSPPQSIAYLHVLAEQQSNPDSRVTLGSTVDALGLPRVELDWRHTELDRASIVRGLELIGQELGRVGLGRLQLTTGAIAENPDAVPGANPLSLYLVDGEGLDRVTFPIGVGFHHLCTTRMAADPADGVVDADGRVHSVDNLWVAGSSVFATGGTATPTFTIVALAARLADHLRSRLAG